MISLEEAVGKTGKTFFKYNDREITEYVPDDIDFIIICRVNNNLWILYSLSN